jgi:hypothetical protein
MLHLLARCGRYIAKLKERLMRSPIRKDDLGPVAFTEKDLEELWHERYDFCLKELKLSDAKAREWADRSIRAIREVQGV